VCHKGGLADDICHTPGRCSAADFVGKHPLHMCTRVLTQLHAMRHACPAVPVILVRNPRKSNPCEQAFQMLDGRHRICQQKWAEWDVKTEGTSTIVAFVLSEADAAMAATPCNRTMHAPEHWPRAEEELVVQWMLAVGDMLNMTLADHLGYSGGQSCPPWHPSRTWDDAATVRHMHEVISQVVEAGGNQRSACHRRSGGVVHWLHSTWNRVWGLPLALPRECDTGGHYNMHDARPAIHVP